MQARILAHIKRNEMQPEQPHFLHQPAQRAVGDVFAVIRLQAVADDAQISQQIVVGRVLVAVELVPDQAHHQAVNFVGRAVRVQAALHLLQQFGRDVDLVGRLRQVVAQEGDFGQIDLAGGMRAAS